MDMEVGASPPNGLQDPAGLVGHDADRLRSTGIDTNKERHTGLGCGWVSAFKDDDVAQVPVFLVVVETVPHHEEVIDSETDVVDLHLDEAPRGFR